VFLQYFVELKAQGQLNTQMQQSLMEMQDLKGVIGSGGGLETTSSSRPTLPTGVSLPLTSLQQVQRVEKMLRGAATSERQKLACAVVHFIVSY